MITINDKQKCSGCHACFSACPKNCISMKADEEGFLYPIVDEQSCVNCGLCDKVCPILQSNQIKGSIEAYAVKNNDEYIRQNSSSGGFFSVVSEWVLSQGGIVFGASFDKKLNVIHQSADNSEGLERLRGSKYVQSIIGDTYLQAKDFLEKGRIVYYTGTPCQIEGLLSFLSKPYDNLITSDIICHGVPSPAVWQKYLDSYSKNDGTVVSKASFRNKDEGWKRFSMKLELSNDVQYRKMFLNDDFMLAFLKNYCLRPSCYGCSFKTIERPSDFTLADFWGIEKMLPEMDDDKGTSLVLVNSEKGQMLFDKLKNRITFEKVNGNEAIKYNIAAVESMVEPKGRDVFMKKVTSKNFGKMVKKHCSGSFADRIKANMYKIAAKLLRR